MNAAKHPGAPEEFPALRAFEPALEPWRPPTDFHFAIDSRAQRIEHARNGYQRGSAFTFYGSKDFRWIRGRFENNRGAQQRWDEQRHELSKNMAQWNERNKAQGMKPALVLAVRFDAAFKRFEICQEISMRKHDAARLACRSRSVENFGDRASSGCIARGCISLQRGRRAGHDIFEITDDHRRWRARKLRLLAVAQDELDPRVFDDALNEIGRRCRIHRHHDGAAQ